MIRGAGFPACQQPGKAAPRGKSDTWGRLSSLPAAWKGCSTCGFCHNAKYLRIPHPHVRQCQDVVYWGCPPDVLHGSPACSSISLRYAGRRLEEVGGILAARSAELAISLHRSLLPVHGIGAGRCLVAAVLVDGYACLTSYLPIQVSRCCDHPHSHR